MHSFVTMSDDGAEVTLQQPVIHTRGLITDSPLLATPRKQQPEQSQQDQQQQKQQRESRPRSSLLDMPQKSLLDDHDDLPSTPSPPTPPQLASATESSSTEATERTTPAIFTCGGGNGCYVPAAEGSGQSPLVVNTEYYSVERTICSLLGHPVGGGSDNWCNGWQAWSYFEVDDTAHPYDESLHLKEDVRKVLRNRVSATHARSRRIKTLKRDLQPFDVSPEKRSIKLSKTMSFSSKLQSDDDQHTTQSGSNAVHTTNKRRATTTTAAAAATGGGDENDGEFFIRTRGLDSEHCYYDSDPEEITRTGRNTRQRTKTSRFHREPSSSPATRVNQEVPDLSNDRAVCSFVQEIINDRYTLVMHPNAEGGYHSCAPVAMLMWIERGQHLKKTLMQPKLVWRQQHQPGKDMSNVTLNTLELLDVVRILNLSRVDRAKFPLAHPRTSFLLETLDRKVVFEASSQSERDRLVMGFKAAVARLGAKIITEDESVFDEFFITAMEGPGDMPDWIQRS